MSYCRWSSDDFQCDVYCYADVAGGYTIHVAANRVVYTGPLPDAVPFDDEHMKEWWARHNAVMKMVETAERKPIGLPHDGERYNEETPELAAQRLESLKKAGYIVPQYAIDSLREENE